MNIYKRIFRPVHIGIVHFTVLSAILCGGYLIVDAVPYLFSGDHSPWYKWALFTDSHILRECAYIILFSAAMGAVFLGLPNSVREYRYFSRYCHVKGLKLRDLSPYSDKQIVAIKPVLEQLDVDARVYFDEGVQEHYFESPELQDIMGRDRFRISKTQYYWAVIGRLDKANLLEKAKKKSQHRWFRPSNL